MNTQLFLVVWLTCGAIGVGLKLWTIAVAPNAEEHRIAAREAPLLWFFMSILRTFSRKIPSLELPWVRS